MNTNEILTKIGAALTGSEFESEWNTLIKNPDFLNLVNAVVEIYEYINMTYPKPVIEKHSMRVSIHKTITNHPAFQTKLGTSFQRIFIVVLNSLMEHTTVRKYVKAVLKAFCDEFSESEIQIIKKAVKKFYLELVPIS